MYKNNSLSQINLKNHIKNSLDQLGFPSKKMQQTSQQNDLLNNQQFGFNLLGKNQRQVLLPFDSAVSRQQIIVHNCLLLPSEILPQNSLKGSKPGHLNTTNRRYHFSHESTRASYLSHRLTSERIKQVKSLHINTRIQDNSDRNMHSAQNIPKLKKHWNSVHSNKLKATNNKQYNSKKIDLKCPPSLREDAILSNRSGCIAIKMQCIPFQIWRSSSRKLLKHRNAKQIIAAVPSFHPVHDRPSNTDDKRNIELLTRQENLRKRLLMDLFGKGVSSQARRPFISYFPHTDYDLALKAYLSRQEERNRFHSLSHQREEEVISSPVLLRRQSCFAFTEFNRERFDIQMSRSELIERILSCKASEQITGNLLQEMKKKVSSIITPLFSKNPPRIPEIIPIDEGLDESDETHTEPNLSPDAELSRAKMEQVLEKHNYDRISQIIPFQFGICESQHKILAELIEEINSCPPSQASPIKSSGKNRTISSEINQRSRQSLCKIKVPLKEHRPTKISRFHEKKLMNKSNDHNSVIQQISNREKYRAKRPIINSIQAKSKNSQFVEQIRNKVLNSSRKQAYGKKNQLKRVNKQSINKTYLGSNAIISQQKKVIRQIIKNRIPKQSIQVALLKQDRQAINPQLLHVSNYKLNEGDALNTKGDNFEVFRLSNRITDSSETMSLLDIASKILNNAAPGLWEQIIRKKMYFLNGSWIKLEDIPGQREKAVEHYARGLIQLSRDRLRMDHSSINLEFVLKVITGQRIIVFKQKAALEKQVLYHQSKGHRIYLLHRRNLKLFNLHDVQNQQDHPESPRIEYEIKPIDPEPQSIFCSFETIIENCQVISINQRISSEKQHRSCIDCQIMDSESKIITLSAVESTSGTITAYFPAYHGTLYVQLVMEKIMRDSNGVKSIGRVYQRLKYDNIYFEFTIKGEYQLRIRLEEQVNTQCKITYEGKNPLQFNLKPRE